MNIIISGDKQTSGALAAKKGASLINAAVVRGMMNLLAHSRQVF